MGAILIALAIAFTPHAPTAAPQDPAVFAPIDQFVKGFNKADGNLILSACADTTSIIDAFPPHEWHGAGACARWLSDYQADAQKKGIKNGVVILTGTRHVDITASRAYVVLVADYEYWQNGKAIKEANATLTVTLQKTQAAGWRILGWAWARP
jgi:hypothetical protein